LWLHNALQGQRRDDEARALLERAYLIDPLHPSIVANLTGYLMHEGEVDRALGIMQRQLEQPEPGSLVYALLSGYYVETGHLVRAHELSKLLVMKSAPTGYAPLYWDAARFGDFATAHAWVERTFQDFPDTFFKRFMAVHVLNWQGRSDEAMREVHAILDAGQPSRSDPDIAVIFGALLSRGGEYEAAVALLEPVIDPAHPEDSDRSPVSALFGLHALAWAYQHTGATEKATWLLVGYTQRCAHDAKSVKYRAAQTLERCAEAQLLLGHDDEALAGLEKAIAAGWREYYLRLHDPYWARLKDDPKYRQLMAKMKADVDRQHAEAAAKDREDHFATRFEAVRKERLGERYRPWSSAGTS